MQIRNKFVLKRFVLKKSTASQKKSETFCRTLSKSFEVWFLLWNSSTWSDAKIEDEWPIIPNLPTNKIKHKFVTNLSSDISVVKKVRNFFRTVSKSFEIWFLLWKSSTWSDAKFEDEWPIILNCQQTKLNANP